MIQVEAVEGPLDEQGLRRIALLYGSIDPKYADESFLAHMFVRGPGGPALHAFALADGEPVAHAAVVPMPALRGSDPLRAGKLEALVVEEAYRGRRTDGEPVVRRVLDALYALSDARGVDVLHAYVVPRVGRAIGFARLDDAGPASLVTLVRPWSSERRNPAEPALFAAQAVGRELAGVVVGARRARGSLRPVSPQDGDLFRAPPVPADRWAVSLDALLEWYASSPNVRILEVPGSRGLVQVPASGHEPLRVAAWKSHRAGPAGALRFLHAAGRLARSSGSTTLRLQPADDPELRRAARLVGFVERRDLTTLWVRARDPSLARPEAVLSTPALYLGF